MKRLTLQWRITILTALVLMICTTMLTVISIFNAGKSFTRITESLPLISTEAFGQESEASRASSDISVPATMLTTPATEVKQIFDTNTIFFGVIITILGTAAVYFVAGGALHPLRQLSKQVHATDEHTLAARLPDPVSTDEISKLTEDFNGMLERLEDAFLRQKRFTANAAHELKTPLAILKTGVQLLSANKTASLSDYQENAQITLASADRLAQVVDDLLLLASAEEFAGTDCEDVFLEPLFEAILGELQPQLEERQMHCIVSCDSISIYATASLLYRSFFNLIDNACKYGRRNGFIYISATKDTSEFSICIRDDGGGISSEHLPHIFDAFYRIDKSRSREMGGSGLGLSIVKSMIEASGGTIAVDSDGKNGTCFTVSFPLPNAL